MRFKNYRRAKNKEIKCKDCFNSSPSKWWGKRIRCGDDSNQYNRSQAVGQNMTCDAAKLKN